MTVEDYYVNDTRIPADQIDPKNDDVRLLLVASILCNDSTNVDGVEVGDPTETALINLGSKIGVEAKDVRERYPRESENPFDSDRKLMATKHTIEGRHLMVVKGAVDVLLNRMDRHSYDWERSDRSQKKIRKKLKHRIRHFQEKDFVYLDLHIRKFRQIWS